MAGFGGTALARRRAGLAPRPWGTRHLGRGRRSCGLTRLPEPLDVVTIYPEIVDGIAPFTLLPNDNGGVDVVEETKPFVDVVAAALQTPRASADGSFFPAQNAVLHRTLLAAYGPATLAAADSG